MCSLFLIGKVSDRDRSRAVIPKVDRKRGKSSEDRRKSREEQPKSREEHQKSREEHQKSCEKPRWKIIY